MEYLILFLSIIGKYSHASNLIDVYKPEYFPDTPNEAPQNEYSTGLTHTPEYNDARRINYADLLSLLHNENSNGAVLAHIDKKGDGMGGEEGRKRMKRDEEDVAKDVDKALVVREYLTELVRPKRNSAVNFSKNLFQVNNKTAATKGSDGTVVNKTLANNANVKKILRSKRNSALKLFSNLFHDRNKTAAIKEPTLPVYLKTSHDTKVNYTIFDVLRNLTGAIQTLNQNMVDFKIEAAKNEDFVLIKMPLANINANVEINKTNSTRSKRDVTTPKLVETDVKTESGNDTIHINEKEKESAKNSTKHPYKSTLVDHRALTTAKPEIPSKTKKNNANKTKSEPNVTKPLEINIDVKLNNNTRLNVTERDKTKNIEEKYDLSANKTKRESNITKPLNSTDDVKLNNTTVNATANTKGKEIEDTSTQANMANTETRSDNIDLDYIERYAKTNVSDLSDKKCEIVNSTSHTDIDSITHPNYKNNDSIVSRGNYRRAIDIYATSKPVDDNEELINLIYQAYSEIEEKLLPINDVKVQYSTDDIYKIGYIVANLETLEVALTKLKTKLEFNENTWKKEKLQNIVKKILMTKHLVDNIMDYLNEFTSSA